MVMAPRNASRSPSSSPLATDVPNSDHDAASHRHRDTRQHLPLHRLTQEQPGGHGHQQRVCGDQHYGAGHRRALKRGGPQPEVECQREGGDGQQREVSLGYCPP